jgi:hypothetical protein
VNRTAWGYHNAISDGLARLPEGMRRRLDGVEFLAEVHPQFAGLLLEPWWDEHPYLPGVQVPAACCYPENTQDRSLTIVLRTTLVTPDSVIHELGHALQYRAGLRWHEAEPVNDYATKSTFEAFAEALVSWTWWPYEMAVFDPQTTAIFDRLSEAPA